MTTITKGYKYRLKPNKQQRDLLARSFGCNRFVYNQCLAKAIKEYEAWKEDNLLPKPRIGFTEFNNTLNELKREYAWLYEVSSVALQQATRHLAQAFTNFFNGLANNKTVGYPKFKKKSNRNSISLTKAGFRFKEGKFYMAGSKDPVKVKWSRNLPSEPSSCTISQEPDGRYYVSFTCQTDPILTNGEGNVGIDVGLTTFATLSNGTQIENPKYFVNTQRKLKRAQQSLSRKVKDSKNRHKARLRVARIHAKIRNQRQDFLHKLSRKLVNENQVIGIEGLKVENMLKNRHLAKGISDVSWYSFFMYLKYKAEESYHCQIYVTPTFYPSSKMCSHCKTSYKELTLKERKWTCSSCGTTHDRDFNASQNLLNFAMKRHQKANGVWQGGWMFCLMNDR